MIRYQLMAVNNSNAWDYVPVPCPMGDPNCSTSAPPTFSLPNAGSNAGLGWEVHLGKLYAPTPPAGLNATNFSRWPTVNPDPTDQNSLWLYVAPDGAKHFLHELPGRDNGTSSLPKRYSKDGSFLRLRQLSSTEARVEFPDGRTSIFESTGSALGTDFCGGGITGCWRFKEMRDPYGNKVSISYSLSGSTESWTINDSTGRVHVIRFDTSNSATGGGDGGETFATQDGDEWGDLRRIITRVQVAAFGGASASYEFNYASATIGRSCSPNSGSLFTADQTITTKVLSSIEVPDALPYSFTTNISSSTACGGDIRGRITGVTLPTRGRISYGYDQQWDFPTRCNYSSQADNTAPVFYRATGVVSKTRRLPDGTAEGTWTYDSELLPGAGSLVNAGPSCTRARYRQTVVDGPVNVDGKRVRTESYHSVFQGPKSPSSSSSGTDWQVTDQGLPYSKDFAIGGAGLDRLFLSNRTYLCTGESCGSALRSTYRRYVSEYRSCSKFNGEGDGAGCFQINPLQLAERTIYHDDGGRYVESRGSSYDGAGHFRVQTSIDTFSGTTTRTTTTRYDATGSTTLAINSGSGYVQRGTPSSYLPAAWILTPYSQISRNWDGRNYITETQFNGQGTLVCSRTRKNASTRTGQDRVVRLTLGTTVGVDAGLPVREEVSGGEFADVGTGSLCSVDTSGSDGRYYRLDHTYADQQLKSTRIGSFPYRYRADIDQATGLPSRVYNAADEGESVGYDRLGRLISITPDASRNEASVSYNYQHPVGGNASVTVSYSDGGTELTNQTTIFDHFVRPVREVRKNPAGASGDYLSDQHTVYDDAGNTITQTTRQRNGSVNFSRSWRYRGFDIYGRAATVTAPDGQVTTLRHFGVRAEDRTVQVQTDDGPRDRSTVTVHDALNRTTQVQTTEHVTTYGHDPNGRVISASRAVPGGAAQTRTYGFDARGYLLSATLPEITGNGGALSFKPDALGLSR
ncbi:MAG: hypothetical protein AAFY88_06410, partial [Acidobacteriota bacterium]